MGALTDEKNRSFDISRKEQDEYATLSQQRATTAQEKGWLQPEIAPIQGTNLEEDEGIRKGTTIEKLSNLPLLFPAKARSPQETRLR